jgi:DNA-binding CsgD family transcriptional regulator
MGQIVRQLSALCETVPEPAPAFPQITRMLCAAIGADWARIGCFDSAGRPFGWYADNADFVPRAYAMWDRLAAEPGSVPNVLTHAFWSGGVGRTLPIQGPDYPNSRSCAEFERPLHGGWVLDARLQHDGHTIGGVTLCRPLKAPRFTQQDAARLAKLAANIGGSLGRQSRRGHLPVVSAAQGIAPRPHMTAEVLVDAAGAIRGQSANAAYLLMLAEGRLAAGSQKPAVAVPREMPGLLRPLLAQGMAAQAVGCPPSEIIRTCMGPLRATVTVVEGMPAPAAAGCEAAAAAGPAPLLLLTLALHETAAAFGARALLERGVPPAQMRVGVLLAIGRQKNEIATVLGIKNSSVEDAARKLYDRFGAHSATEFAMRLWLSDLTPGEA